MGFIDRLEKIKPPHGDWKKRLEEVQKLYNQEKIIEIARNDPNKTVRLAALEKINDQSVLRDIAKSDSNKSVRQAALERISCLE